MVAFSMNIQGMDEVIHEIDRFSVVKNRAEFSNALHRAALLIEGEAKRYCPVRFGDMMRSISTRKITDLTYEVGAHVDYADFIEFGTVNINVGSIDAPLETTSGPPGLKFPSYRPFMRPALYNNKDRILAIIEEPLKKGD